MSGRGTSRRTAGPAVLAGTVRFMPNQAITGHPLVGTEHVYRADLPPYDPSVEPVPGTVVIAAGHYAVILAVFEDWNGVAGLDMLWVRCKETGLTTHVVPADLGLPPLS